MKPARITSRLLIAILFASLALRAHAANVPVEPPPPPPPPCSGSGLAGGAEDEGQCDNPDDDDPTNPKKCDLLTSGASLRSAKYELGLGAADYLANGILHKDGFMFHIEHATLKNAAVYQRPLTAEIIKNQPAGETRSESVYLRQVITKRQITDIIALPAAEGTGYTLSIYRADTRPALSGGYYNTAALPSGSLLKRVTLRNPDGATLAGRLEILEEDYYVTDNAPRRKTILYTEGDTQWTMEIYAGQLSDADKQLLRRETLTDRVPTGNPHGEYTQTRVVEEAGSDGVLHEVSLATEKCAVYRPGETVLLERVRTADGQTRTDRWTFYTDHTNEAAYGYVQSYRRWDGFWKLYKYHPFLGDSVYVTEISPWLDSAYGDESAAYVTQRIENRNLKTKELQNRLVAGKLVYANSTDRRNDAAGNLVETHTEWPDASKQTLVTRRVYHSATDSQIYRRGRLKSEERSDGTLSLCTYAQLSDGSLVTTKDAGSGTLAGGVTDGTRTVTTLRANGELQEEIVTDIASGIEISRRTAATGTDATDARGRVVKYYYNNDPTDYAIRQSAECGTCGNTHYERDRDGRETRNTYDALDRLVSTETGYPGQPQIVTTYQHGENHVSAVTTSGTLTRTTETFRNGFGDIILLTEPARDGTAQPAATQYEKEIDTTTGRRTETIINPDGSTLVAEYHLDGQVRHAHGTAQTEKHYEYGTWTDGLWRLERTGPADSDTWTKTYSDRLGRVVKTETHLGNGALAVTTTHYNVKGQIESTTDADGLTTLYAYNNLGEQTRVALDLNNNGTIDLAGPDRVTEILKQYINDTEFGPSEEITNLGYPEDGSAEPLVTSVDVRSLDDLKTRSESFGRVRASVVTRSINGDYTVTSTAPGGVTTVATYVGGLMVSQQSDDANSVRLSRTDFTHDALGRAITQTDARLGTTTMEYDTAGQLTKITTPDGSETAYTHDSMGRVIKITLPDGTEQFTDYDQQGRVIKKWGAQQYTVAYVFDVLGNQAELHTFKDGDGVAPQITAWIYDTGGRLLQKQYADGHGPSYTYSLGGRLLTRTWARPGLDNQPLTTTYSYTNAGELASVDYSDATPDVNYTYDRLGRQISVTDGAGTRAYSYRASDGALESETHSGLFNATLSREYDSLGRLIKTQLDDTHAVTYAHDSAGRINQVGRAVPGEPQPEETFTYAYLPDSNLIASVTGPAHTVLNTYETNRDVLVKKENKVGTTTISQHIYTVNAIGQRTVREQTGTAFATPSTDAFTYNSRGEVIGSINTQRPSLNTAYTFDGIGNRQTSQDAFGPRDYTANTLNQYTHVGAPQAAPVSPSYDLDGNMLADGTGRAFAWDAENRLIAVETDATRVAYAYDGQSRRVRRTEFSRANPLASWEQTADRFYLYDGWNVIAEYTTGSAGILPALACSYVWGLDLSNAVQGVGGVGGLLSAKEGETAKYFTFDGNGNVSEMLDNGGNMQAHYEYDPFGNTTVGTGLWANNNVWRFSTKPVDAASGLYYYGFRFYDPTSGRWLNRDPLSENGGANLYVFSQNSAISRIDMLGLCTLGEKSITNIEASVGGFRNRPEMQDAMKKLFAAQKGAQIAQLAFVVGGMVYFVT
ncbi:RHS repeat-associated core domain-containing protein, partial [Termitidicoccus mucosus]